MFLIKKINEKLLRFCDCKRKREDIFDVVVGFYRLRGLFSLNSIFLSISEDLI